MPVPSAYNPHKYTITEISTTKQESKNTTSIVEKNFQNTEKKLLTPVETGPDVDVLTELSSENFVISVFLIKSTTSFYY